MQYAGNVLVMGAISPCDGDWYGGLRADDAESFLTALTGVEVCPVSFVDAMYLGAILALTTNRRAALSTLCILYLPECYASPFRLHSRAPKCDVPGP